MVRRNMLGFYQPIGTARGGMKRLEFRMVTDALVHPHNTVVHQFDYAFAENGLTAYKLGKELPSQSFIKHIGETDYKKIVNFVLHYVADLDIPIKR